MENIKKKYEKFLKYFRFLINYILLKPTNKTNDIFAKGYNFLNNVNIQRALNFRVYLISFIVLLFLYLFYLLIPTLYDKQSVEKKISETLQNEFKINFDLSGETSYQILPAPHFLIKDVKIINNDSKRLNELAQIRQLKIYISQKNLFNYNNLIINKLLIKNANFNLNKGDLSFYNNFLGKEISKKKIYIKDSNIFFRNNQKEIISIVKISKITLFNNPIENFNHLLLKGSVFNEIFSFELKRNIIKKDTHSKLTMGNLNLLFENRHFLKKKNISGLNRLKILNSDYNTEYVIKNKILNFKSKNSSVTNNELNYEGDVSLHPFNLNLNLNLLKLDFAKILNDNLLFYNFLQTDILFHKNLSASIIINVEDLTRNQIFDSSTISIELKNKSINFDDSYFLGKNIGKLKITKGKLIFLDNALFLKTKFLLKIDEEKKFYRFFQTNKKFRKSIKNISFDIDLNLSENKLFINSFFLDDRKPGEQIKQILNEFNINQDQGSNNRIVFKNLLNQLLENYDG